MPNKNDILWFKTEFSQKIEKDVVGTPFTVDMLTAIACQETGLIWSRLRKKGLPTSRVLELCVGDSIDAPSRGAFPKTKHELTLKKDGDNMFAIARKGLVDMANETGDTAYLNVIKNPHKFCHGFGIFQFDLQFFLTEPNYFLKEEYKDFDNCLAKCLKELNHGLDRVGLIGQSTLTNMEMASVAIAYNTGHFNPKKGLKQGFFDGKLFYGEQYFDFLKLSQSVSLPTGGTPPLPPPAKGTEFEVDALGSLNLRSSP